MIALALDQLLVLGLLSASIHWLVARSSIMKPLWSRAPGLLDELLRCAGCSGTWIGAVLGVLGVRPMLMIEATPFWLHAVIGGLFGAFLTPVFEAILLWGLDRTWVEREDAEVEEHTPRPPKV